MWSRWGSWAMLSWSDSALAQETLLLTVSFLGSTPCGSTIVHANGFFPQLSCGIIIPWSLQVRVGGRRR